MEIMAYAITAQDATFKRIQNASSGQTPSTTRVIPDILSRKSPPGQLTIQMANAIFVEKNLLIPCIIVLYVTSA
jgi:hypothetical protein